jgi:Reverse transcriptase (RNA-dependent DNA polymerase)
VKQSTLRLLVALAAIIGFKIYSIDVNQAYLQSLSPLLRNVFILPTDVLNLSGNELVQILKPLNGYTDAGDYWGQSLKHTLIAKLRLLPGLSYHTLFFRRVSNQLVGASASHVYDVSITCHSQFTCDLLRVLRSEYDMKEPEVVRLYFSCSTIDATSVPHRISQIPYIDHLRILKHSCPFEDYRSQRARMSWLTHPRPDICCAVSFAAQVTPEHFHHHHVLTLNKLVRYLQETRHVSLQLPALDPDSLQL